MKIRKVEPSVGILGKILNIFSNSKKDTYSSYFINNLISEATEIESWTIISDDFSIVKLKNGVAIQYGKIGSRSYNMNKQYKNQYEYYCDPASGDFVEGLFISAPICLMNPIADTELPRITISSITKDKVSWFVHSSFSGIISFNIHYIAIGKWK